MNVRLSRAWKFLIILLINFVIVAGLLYGFEYYLKLTDPFLKLPFDSYYYERSQDNYDPASLKLPAEPGDYTWGHRVEYNRLGFRERDFAVPKPAGVCRVMVLGDSLTWGAGLAAEERYTHVAESHLNYTFSERQFEVLNFGVSGLPTTVERDILKDYKDLVNPDLIVLGFVYNDTQPRSQGYTLEKEQFSKKYGYLVRLTPGWLLRAGLPQIARLTQKAIDNSLVKAGILPPWEVGVQRTYDPDSPEWQEFRQALQDIRAISDEIRLPPPVFAVLNSDIYLDHPTSIQDLAETLPVYLRWYHQAEQAASETGFVVYDHEHEFHEQLRPEEIPVNQLDNHPSARVNQVYGQKLFETIAAVVNSGELCPPGAVQMSQPAAAAPLAPRRLMQIRLGEQIRFLGYAAENLQAGRGETLRLTFGWQTLAPIETSYTIRLFLVGQDDQSRLVRETLPCQGDCPTTQWPVGMIAPPGSPTIYWPLSARSDLLPLERVFERNHMSARKDDREAIQVVPVPLDIIPFPGSLVDQHPLELDSGLAPGEYRLMMTVADQATGELLPDYDETSKIGLPEAEIILGKIIIQ